MSDTGKFVRESRSKFTQYNIIHRSYWTPTRLHTTGLSNSNLCLKCQEERGSLRNIKRPTWGAFWSHISHMAVVLLNK